MELIKALMAEAESLITRVERAENLNRHYERILRQAVLTHGGKLVIDPKHADEAKAAHVELWIGNGGVSTYRQGEGFSDAEGAKMPLDQSL